MRRIGKSRWRIALQYPGTAALSSLGEDATPWTTAGQYWARRYVKSGRESLTQGQETAVTTVQWFMRNIKSLAVDPSWQLLWTDGNGTAHTYQIKEVVPHGPADSELMITTIEVS